MNRFFFTLFILFPFAELVVFINFCQAFGFFQALLLLFLSAIIGMAFVRAQGVRTLFALNQALQTGRTPDESMFDTLCIALAGVLMILPGFISDFLAFLLLIPLIRNSLHQKLVVKTGMPADSSVLEGEFERADEEETLESLQKIQDNQRRNLK